MLAASFFVTFGFIVLLLINLYNPVFLIVFSFEFCGISKNTFSYRTPPVAASFGSECAFGLVLHRLITVRMYWVGIFLKFSK